MSVADGSPLARLKVVELARILAGPWIGQTLADLGAQVIKVESPEGDDTRNWGPPFLERDNGKGGTERVAAYFHAANRGKSSVCCDFRDEADLQRLRSLIEEADVVIENFKVGGLAKFGLDYANLSRANSGLVYVSVTGFGQTGPRAAQPGYDFMIQGMSGIMDLTGDPAGPPQKVGVAWIDVFTGLYGVIAVQAALAERAKSGKGQQIDLSLLDVGVAVLANQAMNYLVGGETPKRLGNAHPNIVPYQVFSCSDGHIIIACGNNRQFQALCGILALEELTNSERAKNNADRVTHREYVCSEIERATRSYEKSELLDALEAAGIPSGPINSVGEALEDPQILSREMRVEPQGIPGLRSPLAFSRSTLKTEMAAPVLGSGKWSFDP